MKKKAVFITNIPSPYRVDFFSYMQKNFPEYEFHIIFSGAGMENRKWSVEMEEIEHYHFLKSKTIIIRKRFDDRYVFIPVGVEKRSRRMWSLPWSTTRRSFVRYIGAGKRRSRLSAGRTAL